MPSKSVKKAKLYLVSVKLCTAYATPNISLFKLGNSELWRPVIPDPVVGSRSVIHVNNISKTHSSMFFTHPKNGLEKSGQGVGGGGQLTLGPAPLRGVKGPNELITSASYDYTTMYNGN